MKTIHFETIDSTNTYLKNNYQFLDNMTFVSADYQSSGRGRNNRNWKSENGDNLLFSLLIKEESLIKEFKTLSIISAFSLIEVLKEYGIEAKLKWPNDVYVNDRKIAGILLEAVTLNKIECLIIGMGINVNQKEFEGDYLRLPTSIALEYKQDVDLNLFKIMLYATLEDNLKKVRENYDFYKEIVQYDYLKDREVYALIRNEKKKIKVLGIEKDFSLKVEYEGIIDNLESGEISFHI
ncbi:MAG: biotin--[acetyl-CoA-carboxylase] ligase [Erysipelotrichaceae bacterium]|nr:biotin--[acetyl-CoA-carboxylase] ligase [Erysipelotrichaceae bacterium]